MKQITFQQIAPITFSQDQVMTDASMKPPVLIVETDFRFLLPINSGDTIGLLDAPHEMEDALRTDNLHVVSVRSGDSLNAVNDSLNHLIAPYVQKSDLRWFITDAARVLRPGGWLFMGVKCCSPLLSWTRIVRGNVHTMPSVKSVKSSLQKTGFSIDAEYAVRDHLRNPQFFISLNDAGPSQYFFERMYSPNSFAAEIFRRAASLVARRGLQQLLFSDIVLVGQKRINDN